MRKSIFCDIVYRNRIWRKKRGEIRIVFLQKIVRGRFHRCPLFAISSALIDYLLLITLQIIKALEHCHIYHFFVEVKLSNQKD